MNKHAIFHRNTSNYAYAINETTLRIRLRTAHNDIEQAVICFDHPLGWQPDEQGVWHWYKQKEPMTKIYETELFDYWQVEITPKDFHMHYGFLLNDGQETLLYVERGFFREDDPAIIDDINSYFNFPYINAIDVFHAPKWVETTNWYQIFPERFCNGDASLNATDVLPWASCPPKMERFFGGDLAGITQKLDYLQTLGIDGLYLTPIFTAPTSHKYDTIDYLEIDPNFGDKKTFKKLVDEAHNRGMKVMLDAVFNHIGDQSPQFRDVIVNGSTSPYYEWFYIKKWPVTTSEGELIGENYRNFVPNMPKLNTEHPEVKAHLLEVATYWAREFAIDGWRLDVANEVDHQFWREFRQAVKAINPELYILGETWHDSHAWMQGEQFDAVMNYPLTKPMLEWLATQTIDGITAQQSFVEALMRYTDNANAAMFNLIDSHDTPRLMTLANEDLERVKSCYTWMYASPGGSCIFYGSEVGVTGQQDPDCRPCMPWSGSEQQHPLFQHIQTLIRLRKEHEAFHPSVPVQFVHVDTNMLVMKKQAGEHTVYILINGGKTATTYTLPEARQWQNLLTSEQLAATITLAPGTALVCE